MDLNNKTILIISQQPMGEMFLSKHHYAIELASRGNQVYFLHPPDQRGIMPLGNISISSTNFPQLFTVDHRLLIPYVTKFHAKKLYDVYMKFHLRRILKRIGKSIDLVWSFDISDTIPLRCFPDTIKKIFMPVDWPYGKNSIMAAESAEHIFSISPDILASYKKWNVPRHCLHHGVHAVFIESGKITSATTDYMRVGLSGNFSRPDLDHKSLLRIFRENPTIQFECWGNYSMKNSNMGDASVSNEGLLQFIHAILQMPNVKMHGPVTFSELANGLRNMDAFLIGYDVRKDQSRGTNYHKVMEYLAMGKVIISNRIETYRNKDLLVMADSDDNEDLPDLFSTVIRNIEVYNDPVLQKIRIDYAAENTYARQLEKISSFIFNKE
jgi:glycosyltransferase involved in cell wall biosynthesis